MTAREAIKVRTAAGGAAAAAGANPALRSVLLDLCARHGARQILCLGRGGEPLALSLRQAGYAVGEMDAGSHHTPLQADFAPARPNGAAGVNSGAPPEESGRFDIALNLESREPIAALGARVALAANRLRMGGLLLLPIPYQNTLKSTLKSWIVALCDRWRIRHDRSYGPSWSKSHIMLLLESHGFVLVEVIGVREATWRLQTVVWVARRGDRLQVGGDGGCGDLEWGALP